MKNNVIKPKIVSGGKAVPLGSNYYYMNGRKHKNGGIKIGKNAKNGLEVESDEVMHLTDNEVKVFSSVPFLNGESPSHKVLGGENPYKVFKQQEEFKDRHDIEDDGTKSKNYKKYYPNFNKNAMGGIIRNKYRNIKKYGGDDEKPDPLIHIKSAMNRASVGYPSLAKTNFISPISDNVDSLSNAYFSTGDKDRMTVVNSIPTNYNQRSNIDKLKYKELAKPKSSFYQRAKNKISDTLDNNPNMLSDIASTASNTIGGIVNYRNNKKMLNKLKYTNAPYATQATKLKTKININPQLDKMRETVANYERDIDANTSSSRVALSRKQNARLAGMLNTNELYSNKENQETQLINADKMNQQSVSDKNANAYNAWSERKNQFDSTISDKKAENKTDLINNINRGIQDLTARGDARRLENMNMYINSIANPNAAKVMEHFNIFPRGRRFKNNKKK